MFMNHALEEFRLMRLASDVLLMAFRPHDAILETVYPDMLTTVQAHVFSNRNNMDL